ncbi:MAG: hypothetical protein VW891_18435 [Novosphingobium sp.]
MKGVARFLFAFLLVYFFGRTAYQLSFFVKAGLGRYWFYPLATQRPDPCGPRTPPADVLLTSLVPIAGTGTAITTERDTRIGGAFGDRDASFEARSFDDGLSEGAALGARAAQVVAAAVTAVEPRDHRVGDLPIVDVGEAEATASAGLTVLDGLEADAFAHAGEQSLELFGIEALGQVADVKTNAHGMRGKERKRVGSGWSGLITKRQHEPDSGVQSVTYGVMLCP